jgi:hypothetical protein
VIVLLAISRFSRSFDDWPLVLKNRAKKRRSVKNFFMGK